MPDRAPGVASGQFGEDPLALSKHRDPSGFWQRLQRATRCDAICCNFLQFGATGCHKLHRIAENCMTIINVIFYNAFQAVSVADKNATSSPTIRRVGARVSVA